MDIRELAGLWLIRLRSEGKSAHTIAAYQSAVRQYAQWCDRTGTQPDLTRGQCERFGSAALDGRDGLRAADPATVEVRVTALRGLSAYLAGEGVIPRDDLRDLRPPKRRRKVIPKITETQLAALYAACKGSDFAARRDMAAVRLLATCGLRVDELLSLTTDDIDLPGRRARIRKAKGGSWRVVPLTGPTAEALAWYLRVRGGHRLAGTPALWLGQGGRATWGYAGCSRALTRRAEAAGITGFHAHRLRHSWAASWLEKGGSEQGLMLMAGWRGREMVDRYTQDAAAERAIEEARRLADGDDGRPHKKASGEW